MLLSVQPSCAEIAGNPTESIDLESEPPRIDKGHDDVLRPISKGMAVEDDAAWQTCFFALKANQSFWTPYHRSSALWAFFQLKGPEMNVDVRETQKLRCTVCHPTEAELDNSSGRGTRSRKGIFQYNLAHGITSMPRNSRDISENRRLTKEKLHGKKTRSAKQHHRHPS